ncbi:divalent metal cation transporter, partial [Clavibacter michiganensis]|uniref:divalent metal cation transporter n=1 Tax=Clavibacter michiganensis TaxID=28447 RepID=UPI0034DB5FF7
MGGFLRYNVPVLVRRLITFGPSLAVLWRGVSPPKALVLSQGVLLFGIPFALLPLILFTRDKTLMGRWLPPPCDTGTQNTEHRSPITDDRKRHSGLLEPSLLERKIQLCCGGCSASRADTV